MVLGSRESTGQSANAHVVLTYGGQAEAERYPQPIGVANHRQPISITDHRESDHSEPIGIADHRKSNARADTGTDPVAHDFCQTDRGSNPGAVSGAIDLATAKPNPNRLADIDAIALSHGFAKRSANISAVAKSDDGHTDGGTDAG